VLGVGELGAARTATSPHPSSPTAFSRRTL
jgi:hypothetical protein